MGFFDRLKAGMQKTRDSMKNTMDSVFSAFSRLDDDLYDELEEALVLADLSGATAMEIVEELRDRVKAKHITEAEQAKGELRDIITEILTEGQQPDEGRYEQEVIVVIGVNGVGKTTSIGKIAARNKAQGKSVLLAAADTFRAAAADQLQIWADRNDVPIVRHEEGADPAAVVFDACQSAKSKKTDVLICDTAGRLHNKKNLMEELKKIRRVVEREMPDAKVEVLLVLDATIGQNAVSQAQLFTEAAQITGIVLTKLDGTAKGGIVIDIKKRLGLSVKYIGVGEGIDDMQEFDAYDFASALFDGE